MSNKPETLTTGRKCSCRKDMDYGKPIIEIPILGFVPIPFVLQLNYQYHNLYRIRVE